MATAAPLQSTPAHQPPPSYTESTSTSSNNNDSNQIEIPRGPITATLNFYKPPEDGSTPYNYVDPPSDGSPQRNFTFTPVAPIIKDIRNQENLFNLDIDAFAAVQNVPSSMTYKDWNSESTIQKTYYPEVEQFILDNVPGSNKIVIFDHTIRRTSAGGLTPDKREPVMRVHIDQTNSSTLQRIHTHLSPQESSSILTSKTRYRIINIWRPLKGPVVSSPLAFASSKSVKDKDLIPVEHRYPDKTGETAAVRYDEGQEWFYWSGMEEGERLLLKCFDSEGGEVGLGGRGRVPHTAFVDPRTEGGWPGRESVEVRALVFG